MAPQIPPVDLVLIADMILIGYNESIGEIRTRQHRSSSRAIRANKWLEWPL